MGKPKQTPKRALNEQSYTKFDKINGKHPLKQACDASHIDYHARKRKGGKVTAFNFELAKEIGLIPSNHPLEMNPELEQKILETFSLIIINEYDLLNDIEYPDEDILPNTYMATRYLQLQHPNKQGKTSGDGRSIWNGQIRHKGVTYDISSCGTGATQLSPATHIKNKFFQTGDPTISYGCGYSEVDEGLATLFFSEIFHKNLLATERCLGIITFKKGISINIRVHSNLLRPSHFFNHLKQNNLKALREMVEYHSNRQEMNGAWKDIPQKGNKRLEYFRDQEIAIFAKLAARLEDEYIFCWMDWDGDNILMDGGIIDYGSIRQFGLYHSEYRYDDVERYSTSISEQKKKAKYTAQTFVQMIDFLITGEKKPVKTFNKHQSMEKFEEIFNHQKLHNLLYKVGLREEWIPSFIKNHKAIITDFKKVFSYFERTKSSVGLTAVPDGITWDAVFCMRDILRELPQLYLVSGEDIEAREFIEIIKSNYAQEEDVGITPYRQKMITNFQQLYKKIIHHIMGDQNYKIEEVLLEITMRSSVINKYDRVTGDSITKIIDKILAQKPKLNSDQLYSILKEFTEYQNLRPDSKRKKNNDRFESSKDKRLYKKMLKIVKDCREGL